MFFHGREFFGYGSVALSTLLFGCSSENTPPPRSSSDAGSGLVGSFNVRLIEESKAPMMAAYTIVQGKVYDGPIPPVIPLSLDRSEGSCQLLKPTNPFCSPGCGVSAACVENGKCLPYPNAQNVGVVRVQGVSGSEITMDPFPPSFSYSSMMLSNPSCAEGSDVKVLADSFSMQAKCIAPLVVPVGAPLPVKRAEVVPVRWTPAGTPDVARVQIKLDISHHGGKKGEINCDVADTGSFDIPAALVTALVDLGLAGFPTIAIIRESVAAATAHPNVVLKVSADVNRDVDTGVKSCNDDVECAPLKCDLLDHTCK